VRSNGRAAAGLPVHQASYADEFAHYDALPPQVRWALQQGVINISAIGLHAGLDRLRSMGRFLSVDEVVSTIRKQSLAECVAFSEALERRGHAPLASVAADVAPLVDEPGVVRRASRRPWRRG
jgi:hypothetical protein